MTQRAHSDLGASGMYRWMACPGSYHLSKKAGRRRTSIHAATGTLAHQIIETAVTHYAKSGQWPSLNNFKDDTTTIDGYDLMVDLDLLDGISVMLGYLAEVAQRYAYVRSEMRITLDPLVKRMGVAPPEPLTGTADVVLLNPLEHMLEIVDYKNGAGVLVSIRDNPQLLYYAAGVLVALDKSPQRTIIDRVRITVVQPHASGLDKIRSQDFDVIDVMLWVEEVLLPAVQAAADPGAALVPGEHCRFCPASHSCPALMASAMATAKKDFTDHILPATMDELAKQLVLAEQATLWAEALRTYAVEQLQRQERIPGWGLEPTRPTRRWVSETDVITALGKLGLPLDTTHRMDLKSPAQLEKAVKRGHLTFWETQIQPLIESKSSGVKLVRTDTTDPVTDFMEE